jgi:hypothetical protein
MPLINSSYTANERQWLGEYLATYAPGAIIQFEKMLTRADLAAQRRLGQGVSPRSASRIVAKLDAWVDLPTEIQIWEAKRHAPTRGVHQLVDYREVLPTTWEGANQAFKPLTWHLLVEHSEGIAEQLAAKWGIFFHVYLPDWLKGVELAAMQRGEQRRLEYLDKLSGRV